MKISIAIAILILAIGFAVGWRGHRELADLKVEHRQLVEEAEEFGISTAPAAGSAEKGRLVHRERAPREAEDAEVRVLVTDLVNFVLEMKRLQESGDPPADADFQARIVEMVGRVLDLNASQLKAMIAGIREAPGLDDDSRGELTGFAVMMLANDHPQVALALFSEASDLLLDERMKEHLVPAALARWAQDDPVAALDWFQQNGKDIEMPDHGKQAILAAMAAHDPARAFQLIEELEIDRNNALSTLMRTARTPEERTRLVEGTRDYIDSLPEPAKRDEALRAAFGQLGAQLMEGGFDSATEWLAEADLSDDEKAAVVDRLHWNPSNKDPDRWIGWISDNLPQEQADQRISNLVQNWTRHDYVAAGTWLADQPDGPAKTAAVESFARTVGPHDPEAAAKWAKTLPAEKQREILRGIHREIEEPAAAEDFAERHGIGRE